MLNIPYPELVQLQQLLYSFLNLPFLILQPYLSYHSHFATQLIFLNPFIAQHFVLYNILGLVVVCKIPFKPLKTMVIIIEFKNKENSEF